MHFLWFGKDKQSDDGGERVSLKHDPAFGDFVALAYGDRQAPHSMRRYLKPVQKPEHKEPSAPSREQIKLLPGIPQMDSVEAHPNKTNEAKKVFTAPDAEQGSTLEEFYDQKDAVRKFADKDEEQALRAPWAYKYRPAMEAFKNFNTMEYEIKCGVSASGGKIAFFDPEVRFKHKEKEFDPVFLSHMVDGVKSAASEFDKAYQLEAARSEKLPPGLTPQQTEIYLAALARAKQFESVIGPIHTLLQQPIKVDMNDSAFQKLAHMLTDYYQLTKNARFYHTIGEDPLSAAEDQYFDTSLAFRREMNERKNSLWTSPEIDKIHLQVATLERYRKLGILLDDVQSHCMFLASYEKQNKDQFEWYKEQTKQDISQIKLMVADDCLRRDLIDPQLVEQHDLIERCQKRLATMMPSMLQMETLLDAGAGKGKLFDASIKLNNSADFMDSPFRDLYKAQWKLNDKQREAIETQVRKAARPSDE
jgi:hypothetical protein